MARPPLSPQFTTGSMALDDHLELMGRLVDEALSIASDALPSADYTAPTTDHGELDGLTDDDHTQYANLSGRSGGQILIGGLKSGETLQLYSRTGGGLYDFDDEILTLPANANIQASSGTITIASGVIFTAGATISDVDTDLTANSNSKLVTQAGIKTVTDALDTRLTAAESDIDNLEAATDNTVGVISFGANCDGVGRFLLVGGTGNNADFTSSDGFTKAEISRAITIVRLGFSVATVTGSPVFKVVSDGSTVITQTVTANNVTYTVSQAINAGTALEIEYDATSGANAGATVVTVWFELT